MTAWGSARQRCRAPDRTQQVPTLPDLQIVGRLEATRQTKRGLDGQSLFRCSARIGITHHPRAPPPIPPARCVSPSGNDEKQRRIVVSYASLVSHHLSHRGNAKTVALGKAVPRRIRNGSQGRTNPLGRNAVERRQERPLDWPSSKCACQGSISFSKP